MRNITTTTGELITRVDLCRRWQVSLETLKRRERAGILPFLKLGRGIRYRPETVEQIEQQSEVRP